MVLGHRGQMLPGIFLPAAKPASLMDQKWTPPCKIVTCRGQRDIGTYIIEAREFDSQLSFDLKGHMEAPGLGEHCLY